MKSDVNALSLRGRLTIEETGSTMKTIVAIALLALSAGASAGQINKCVDAGGKVVGYGDCPPGSRSEASSVKSAPPPAPAPAAKSSAPQSVAEKDADYRKRQMEKKEADEKSAKKAEITAQNARACEDSRAYLKSLQSGNRITRNDPKTGERVFLQDGEYATEIARVQKNIDNNCR